MKLWDILKEHNWNIDEEVELLKNLNENVVKIKRVIISGKKDKTKIEVVKRL